MITVIGNQSANELNSSMWSEAINAGKINYIVSESFLSQMIETEITILSYLSIARVSESFFRKYKETGGHLILYLFDSMAYLPSWLRERILTYTSDNIIDCVFSFDNNDCSLFNYNFWPQICSKFENISLDSKPGFYFAGRNKHRIGNILKIYNLARINGFHTKLRIPDLTEKQIIKLIQMPNIELFTSMIPYQQMLEEELSFNCIYDIVQPKQYGFSWRIVEGIMYNKKIITTNENIMESPFYNPKYIKIVTSIEDIDFEWANKNESINYNYNNEFSPILFIDHLKKIFS